MQRTEAEGIVISCDFCGTDWDPFDQENTNPMVEGHHGSVICLSCLKRALAERKPAESGFNCTMCLEDRDAGAERWFHPTPVPSEGLNPEAAVCLRCIHQAAGRFHKDPDVSWTWEGEETYHGGD